jgi:hypothetical protein
MVFVLAHDLLIYDTEAEGTASPVRVQRRIRDVKNSLFVDFSARRRVLIAIYSTFAYSLLR